MSWPIELSCGNCDFYAPSEAYAGVCRRHPPKGVVRAIDMVGPSYWCGEWRGAFLAESPVGKVTP